MAEPAIAGYHSFTRIGRGGLGDVFRAIEASTGTPVAVKVLRDVSDSSTVWHRTRRELAALVALSGHPNVIESIELVERDEGPALVMEYAAGGSVADHLRDREATAAPCFTVAEAVFVGRQTATALVAAHQRGIVHRDIKPQNLLIDDRGQIKLCDFGIAALTHDDQYRTRTNAVSMRYASPEDLESDQPVGPASDVYSLGATMLHLVHGAPPTLRDRLLPWSPPASDDPGLAALDHVIAACLHPEPAMRPSAQELLGQLEALAAIEGTEISALPVGEHSREAMRKEHADESIPLIKFDEARLLNLEALTVRRPHRLGGPLEPEVPVVVTRPKVDTSPHRAQLATVAVASVVLVLVVALLGWRWLLAGETALAEPTTGPRPATLVPLLDTEWSAGAVGDCLVQLRDQAELQVVDCRQPHDLQRISAGSLEADLAAVDVPATVDAECAASLAAFVGRVTDESRLDVARTRPSAESWRTGDREFQCFVGMPDRRLVGDARNTGW